jgi:hypothetical protein
MAFGATLERQKEKRGEVMGTISVRKQKKEKSLRKLGINPKGTSKFWNKTIPEGYTFQFPKKVK